MASMKKVARTSKKRVPVEEVEEKPGIFDSLKKDTVRGIAGVFLFVFAIILVLGALGMAGLAGEKLYWGISFVVGVGYYLLPFMLVMWAKGLFTRSDEGRGLRSIRTVGALIFFIASLGIIGVLTETRAGILGSSIAGPMLTYLDTIASLVILAGFLVVSLLLLFDSELWVLLFSRIGGLFKKPEGVGDATTVVGLDTDSASPLQGATTSETTPPVKTGEPVPAPATPDDAPYEEPDEEDDEDEDLFVEEVKKKERPKPVFVIPSAYTPPPVSLLESDRNKASAGDTKARANLIRRTLQHFKIPVEMDEITVGPTVTRYALKPAEGVKLSKILALQSNLELALAASPIRIEAPIPGKSLVGIEVPNTNKSTVGLAGLIDSPEFSEETIPLFVTLGKDIAGKAHYANIGKMPHLLVAGTTGSGKSVMIHSLVTSLLYRNGPERLKFIMVDPKRVELTLYDNIPHLLTPVITEAKKCIQSLKWATKEMERRYDVLQQHKMQDIGGYHTEVLAPALAHIEQLKNRGKEIEGIEVPELMPHIVIMIDELADIMTAYPRELEAVIVRLAQMSRAVGIHLVLSTQRPEVKVITGLIKANIPTRIALKVNSVIDSRTILDQTGAEKLLGAGDMLYLSGDMSKPRRIQSPFLTTAEVKKVTEFLIKSNGSSLPELIDFGTDSSVSVGSGSTGSSFSFDEGGEGDELDEIYEDVRELVIKERKASTSLIQRRFKVGYGRAARIMDQLETRGVIAGSDGTNRQREVIGAGGSSESDAHADTSEDERTGYDA
jgi:DNA segregation ATPase FtsK/SpoIIIE, S-DNA-T family